MNPRIVTLVLLPLILLQGSENYAAGKKTKWFGAFPGAFGLGRAQPQRRGTSP